MANIVGKADMSLALSRRKLNSYDVGAWEQGKEFS